MNRYALIKDSNDKLPLPEDKQIKDNILKNNFDFTIWYDPVKDWHIIECDNMPRDMPLFGVSFIGIPRQPM